MGRRKGTTTTNDFATKRTRRRGRDEKRAKTSRTKKTRATLTTLTTNDDDNDFDDDNDDDETSMTLLFSRIDEEELLEESEEEEDLLVSDVGCWKKMTTAPSSTAKEKEREEGDEEEHDGCVGIVVVERSEQTTSDFVASEEKADATSATTKEEEENTDDENDPVHRLLKTAHKEDEKQMMKRATVPEGFDVAFVNEREVSADARLKQLNKLFQREDERIGDISRDVKECFGIVLEEVRTKEAVGYLLFHDAKVHEWEAAKKLTVAPPRLSHVFVKPEYWKRGFGTALVSRWIKEFAIDTKAFAVDMPNGKMLKLLRHSRCEVAVEKSGFEAGTIHFLNLPI